MIGDGDNSALLSLIDDFMNGRLDAAGVEDLQTRMREDEAARLTYVEYLDLHGELLRLFGHEERLHDQLLTALEPPRPAPRRVLWAASVAVAVVLCGAGLLLTAHLRNRAELANRPGAFPLVDDQAASRPRELPPIAARIVRGEAQLSMRDMVAAPDREPQARRAHSGAPPAGSPSHADGDRTLGPGDELRIGDVVELSGEALELSFSSGARCVLTRSDDFTTARLEVRTGNSCELGSGVALFSVPSPAKGFTVLTGAGRFVDLGTEFGLAVEGFEKSEVHVLDGSVTATSVDGAHTVELRQGRAALLRYSSPIPQLIRFAADKFSRPASLAQGVEHISPAVHFHPTRPAGLGPNVVGRPEFAHLVREAAGLSTDEELVFNSATLVRTGTGEPDAGGNGATFRVPAGTPFDVFVLQFGPNADGSGPLTADGELRFQRPILAVITESEELIETARQVGGYPIREAGDDIDPMGGGGDELILDEQSRTLRFRLRLGTGGTMDQLRVLVAAEESSQ